MGMGSPNAGRQLAPSRPSMGGGGFGGGRVGPQNFRK
jgi:hypothetical protein